MNPVDAALLETVRAFLLAETGRITRQRQRKRFLRQNLIDELADHGVFTGSDQKEILSFDFVHHRIHFRKAHHA